MCCFQLAYWAAWQQRMERVLELNIYVHIYILRYIHTVYVMVIVQSDQSERWSEQSLNSKVLPTNGIFWGLYMQHNCTVKSTPVVSLCLSYMVPLWLLLTNIILCVIMCTVSAPLPSLLSSFKISQSVDTVGCHSVSSAGVSIASVAVTSQKTQRSISLLTSSVCLAACLIAGVCSGEEERRLSQCTRRRQA